MVWIRSLVLAAGLVPLLVACVAIPPYQAATAGPNPASAPTIDLLEALVQIYPDRALVVRDATVLLDATPQDPRNRVDLVVATPFKEMGTEKYFVVTAGATDTCNICPARIDVAIFALVEDAWRLETLMPKLTELGWFGFVPPGTLRRIGRDKFGAVFVTNWMGQGYTNERTTIIAKVGAELRVVFDVMSGFGADFHFDPVHCAKMSTPCQWGYSSEISFHPGKNPSFYDIRLIQHGTDEGGREFTTDQTFVFARKKYSLRDDTKA